MTGRRLVFVYNADSGLFNTLADAAHKLLSLQTYACNLCAITHTPFAMRSQWRRFLDELGIPCAFLHRDELRRRHPDVEAALPAVFHETAAGLTICLDATRINRCTSMEALGQLIREHCLCTAAETS